MHLEVFSRKWRCKDRYHIRRTQTGWEIINAAFDGVCDKAGNPALFRCLDQDEVNYPADLGDRLQQLWDEAEVKQLSNRALQERFEMLSDWMMLENSFSRELVEQL